MTNQVEINDKKFKDYIQTIMNMVNADFAEDQNRIKMFLRQRAEAAKSLDNEFTVKTKLYPINSTNTEENNQK